MLKLPQTTLVALTGIGYKTEEHKRALELSCLGIEFGKVLLLEMEHIKDINSWNKAVIYDLPDYIKTDFCLLIHADGYVVNPKSWNNEWLNYDFIGAPFPLPNDNYSYRDESGEIVRVGNSVSLRSKKLIDLASTREWKPYYGFFNEDGFITCHNRNWLESRGCNFAPLEVAKWFGRELDIPENEEVEKPFCFHLNKVNPGRNIQYVNR